MFKDIIKTTKAILKEEEKPMTKYNIQDWAPN